MDGLLWDEHPTLRDPVLVAAFEGWNDAGDAATGAADWLIGRGGVKRFAHVDPEEHMDYQSRRPVVRISQGVAESVTWPANDYYGVPFPERDLVVLRGVEPNVRWKSFSDTALTVARETGCTMVVTLGALIGDVPHTRPVRVMGSVTDPNVPGAREVVRSRYEGPTGIVGALNDRCLGAGLPAASLWAPVPHYVSTAPNPPATLGLLERLSVVTGIEFDLSGFDRLTALWRAEVDAAVSDNDEVQTYIRALEASIDEEAAAEQDVPPLEPASGDELAAELEQFLREQRDD